MDDWEQDWGKAFDLLTSSVEQFCQDIAKEVSGVVDALADFSEDMAQQIEGTIAPEVDRWDEQFAEWADSFLQIFFDFEQSVSHTAEPIVRTVDPILNQHSACVGCCNYHGQAYGGNMLVCAMHPHGWATDESCPDWESVWKS